MATHLSVWFFLSIPATAFPPSLPMLLKPNHRIAKQKN